MVCIVSVLHVPFTVQGRQGMEEDESWDRTLVIYNELFIYIVSVHLAGWQWAGVG